MGNVLKIVQTGLAVSMIAFLFDFSAYGDGSAAPTNGTLDAASAEALQKTTLDLQSPANRQALINANPQAKAADAQAQQAAPGNSDAVYGLSSEILEKIVKETGGDPQKMQEIMAQAQANPEGFYKTYFNDEQKAKISNISRSVSSTPSSTNANSNPQVQPTAVAPVGASNFPPTSF